MECPKCGNTDIAINTYQEMKPQGVYHRYSLYSSCNYYPGAAHCHSSYAKGEKWKDGNYLRL